MATQSPFTIRDALLNLVNSAATLLDNGHRRATVGIGGPDGAADLAPCSAAQGLSVFVTNPGGVTPVSTHHRIASGSGDAVSVKSSAGTLRSVHVFNESDAFMYVKFHNTAGTPTVGSGVVFTVGVQAGTSRDVVLPGGGRAFATGIGMTIVTGIVDPVGNEYRASIADGEMTFG